MVHSKIKGLSYGSLPVQSGEKNYYIRKTSLQKKETQSLSLNCEKANQANTQQRRKQTRSFISIWVYHCIHISVLFVSY